MFKITIITIGKIKKDYFRNGIDEYLKRLSVNAKVEIEELKPEPFFDNSDQDKIRKMEGEKITRTLKKYSQDKIIILDERGKKFSSGDFSNFLNENTRENLVFVIGGALGFSKEVLNYPRSTTLALSEMTLPHEMARLVLVEQIYRAIAISKNKKYHY